MWLRPRRIQGAAGVKCAVCDPGSAEKEQLLFMVIYQMINLAGDTETKLTDLLGDMF